MLQAKPDGYTIGAVWNAPLTMTPHTQTVAYSPRDFVPIALMTGGANVAMEVWVRARGIPLFRKPLDMDAIQTWIGGIKKPDS